jgi:hypothetical protein
VAGLAEPAQLLDIKVDQLARPLAPIPVHRRGRIELRKPAKPRAPQPARDGGARQPRLRGDRRPGQPQSPAQANAAAAAPVPVRNRASHLRTVRIDTAKAAATSAAVRPDSTRATRCFRLCSVRRAA